MKLGPYEVEEEIGRGGAGAVYKARGPRGELVAVKVLLRMAPEALHRFDRERRLQGTLGEEAGFVPLLDAGNAGTTRFLVMPFLSGGTLRDRLARGPLPLPEAIELARTLARALARAHSNGIVHRDLKPENVLFDARGRALVADLGLAKYHEGPNASHFSTTGVMVGTVGYMAPEQLADGKAAGPRADVFALGAISYEALAGLPPFPGDTAIEIVASMERGTLTPLARVRPEAPPWLVHAVMRSLERDPARRFADAKELLAALDRAAPRRRGLGLAAALVTLLVLGAAGVAASTRTSPPPKPAPAPASAPPPAAPAPDPRQLAQQLITAGTGLANLGRAGDAAPFFERAIELDPENMSGWWNRALFRSVRGDHEGAARDYERVVALAPEDLMGWVNLGAERKALGQGEAALAAMSRALEIDPDDVLTLRNRAILRGMGGDEAGAVADFDRAIARAPSDPDLLVERAKAHTNRNDFRAAAADATRALALDPGFAPAHAMRGYARGRLGQLTAALEDLDRALELSPEDPFALQSRGTARAMKGDGKGALADFDRLIALVPDSLQALKNRGSVHQERHENAAAVADFEAVLRLAPDDPEAPRFREEVAKLRAAR